MVKCPAHEDRQASLHVAPGSEQPVVMHCQADCDINSVLEAGNVDIQQLLADRDTDHFRLAEDEWTPAGPASHCYDYTDEEGNLLYQVLRIPPQEPDGSKTFRQRHRDPSKKGGWAWSMAGVRRVLYRLPEVIQAISEGRTIYLVEGEKDVESLRQRGFVATTAPMGAGKWDDSYTEVLCNANIVIIADADEPGRKHAREVREQLIECAASVEVVEALGVKDVSDHFAAGLKIEQLVVTIPAVEESKANGGIDVLDVVERPTGEFKWVIPHVLSRGERLILTAFEGHGKSTAMRQWSVMAAAGIHPWTLQPVPPQKVLFIDAENHPDQIQASWSKLLGLAAHMGLPVPRGKLIVIEAWDNDIDLTQPAGRQWLSERVHAHQPDLVSIGPLYNLADEDLKEDKVARKLKKAINEARGICGSAFLMEHHAPHKAPGDRERSIRPYGSSVFLKWPDYGYGLKPMEAEGFYEFQPFRFPRVRERHFPVYLRNGKPNTAEFPWMPAHEDSAGNII